MILPLLIPAALAAEPGLLLRWRGDALLLTVEPPAGEHLAPEAPVDAWAALGGRRWGFTGDGAALEPGLSLPRAGRGPERLEGALRLSLCEDGGTTCRVVELSFDAEVAGRRGRASAAVQPGWRAPEAPASAHPALPPELAFSRAQAEGRLVLLDFSAVWCPPCNLMGAEVLEDPADSAALSPFVVALVDVDQPDSWALKSRYAVRGYPTLVVTTAEGALIDRLEGYPGEAELLGWLGRAAGGLVPLDQLLAQAEQLSPAEAGHGALRLARAGRLDESRALQARADQGADARIARLITDPSEEDLLWLCDHARGRALEWAFEVDGASLSAQAQAALRAALAAATAAESPVRAADLLYVQATMAPPEQAPALYAAAAALLRQALTGDPALDRGYYTSLADLYQAAGQPEAALGLLRDAAAAFPHEFTFFYAAAGLLLDQGRAEEALPWALAAQALAYGDNHLRAVRRHAEILHALGRDAEALALLDETLAAAARPAEGQVVRTARYLNDLEQLRAQLAAP